MASVEDQLELEQEMLQLGVDRQQFLHQRRVKGGMESLSVYGEALTKLGVEPLAKQVAETCKKILAGEAGINMALMNHMCDLHPYKVAATAMRVVVDRISQTDSSFTVLAGVIGEMLWMETQLSTATAFELKMHKKVRRKYEAKKQDVMRLDHTKIWDYKETVAIGGWLLFAIATCTGMIDISYRYIGKRNKRIVNITKECMDWITDVRATNQLLCPFRMPMIAPPRSYNNKMQGGYYTQFPHNDLTKDHTSLQIVAHVEGALYLQAANMQQAIPWKINNQLLEHVQYAWEHNFNIGSMNPREGWPIPPYPKGQDDDSDAVKEWKFAAYQIHRKNDKTMMTRIKTAKQLWIANRMAGYEEIYFPVQIDFRGRYYYIPPFLNPQGGDIARSLLKFSKGKPIANADDAHWLYAHGAGMYGYTKSTWQDRVDWVKENHLQIMQTGADVWGMASFWNLAKEPWQFLAFCLEYYNFNHHGYGYVCSLPVVLDCTCSGVQHYSALLRSEDMAKLVNLTDTDKPQDIYSVVLNEVLELLRHDAANNHEHAADWLQLQPDRTLLKKIVMTIPYSASRTSLFGFVMQWAFERTEELYGSTDNWKFKNGTYSASYYLTNVLTKYTQKHINPAIEAMDWLKTVGKAAGASKQTLQWHSPSGLLVLNKYTNISRRVIKLNYLSPVTRFIVAAKHNDTINKQKTTSALSPNIIHSLDASHMALTSVYAKNTGITNFGGIHDCFATTPAEMSLMREAVRHAFSDLYSFDWWGNITNELLQQLPSKVVAALPPRPVLGSLNTNQTRSSSYFIT